MLKNIERDSMTINPIMKHVIMMLKYGKKSENSLWAESNMTKEMVTDYYNSLSPEDSESLRNIFFEIGFEIIKERTYVMFKKMFTVKNNMTTDQEKEIIRSLFGDYNYNNIFIRSRFYNRCGKLLKKIASRNKLNSNILDLIEERV